MGGCHSPFDVLHSPLLGDPGRRPLSLYLNRVKALTPTLRGLGHVYGSSEYLWGRRCRKQAPRVQILTVPWLPVRMLTFTCLSFPVCVLDIHLASDRGKWVNIWEVLSMVSGPMWILNQWAFQYCFSFFFQNQGVFLFKGKTSAPVAGCKTSIGVVGKVSFWFSFINCYLWEPNGPLYRILGTLSRNVCRCLKSCLNVTVVLKGKPLFPWRHQPLKMLSEEVNLRPQAWGQPGLRPGSWQANLYLGCSTESGD